MRLIITISLCVLLASAVSASTSQVKKIKGQWNLFVDKKPFEMRGVNVNVSLDTNKVGAYLRDLTYMGANTISLPHQKDQIHELLDSCQQYGIKVMLELFLPYGNPENEGAERIDYVNDQKKKEYLIDSLITVVEELKDAEALTLWSFGSEVIGNTLNDRERHAYGEFLELLIQKVKIADATRAITSISAGVESCSWWRMYVPSLDIYGINSFGSALSVIPKKLREMNVYKPYMVTKFGVTEQSDVPEDYYGVKQEPGDDDKYKLISKGYKRWIRKQKSCVGGFVYNYARGKNYSSHWMNLYFGNYRRAQYWAARAAFTGKKPFNYIPEIVYFEISNGKAYKTGDWIPVVVKYDDPEGDQVKLSFYYNIQDGSDKKRNAIQPLEYVETSPGEFKIKAPEEYGAIKVYVFAKDANFNMGSAFRSIKIVGVNPKAGNKNPLGENVFGLKANLPFYLFSDAEEDMPYSATGFMGNVKEMEFTLYDTDEPYSGSNSIRIDYGADEGWFGVAFQDPAFDWWSKPGGYNLNGAQRFCFWARATEDNVPASFRIGLYNNSRAFYDTAIKSKKILLSTDWKKYSLDLNGLNLSNIKTGFVFFGQGIDDSYSIYLDDLVFE